MTRLDHLGILVPRLEEAAALMARLGFTLTRRAEHRVASGASAGSAQCSVMLETGYVELQELTDIHGTHILAPAVRRNFGLHTLAYGVDDAHAAREAASRHGLTVTPVMEWTRRVEEDDLSADARFAFFVADYASADDAFLCWVRHLTPEALRSPRLTRHANGARALRSAVIATRGDPARLVARQVAAGGTAEGDAVRFADGTVEVHAAATLPPIIAEAAWPNDDWFVALRLAFDNPSIIADRARREGFGVSGWNGSPLLDLRAPLGCFLVAGAA